jgi:hypothetical protein
MSDRAMGLHGDKHCALSGVWLVLEAWVASQTIAMLVCVWSTTA